MCDQLPTDWRTALAPSLQSEWFAELEDFVADQRREAVVFPPPSDVYSAFHLTPLERVRVVVLGQDPYHGDGQAHGLCFSVRPGVKHPPSLRNIFKERDSDLGIPPPVEGNLDAWAREGVLLLNTVLTVREAEANSHRKRGWEKLTDDVIRCLGHRDASVVFVLWGKPAQAKRVLIDTDSHRIVEAPHPSPLSASRGFFGSRPFSCVNQSLAELRLSPIDWRVDEEL